MDNRAGPGTALPPVQETAGGRTAVAPVDNRTDPRPPSPQSRRPREGRASEVPVDSPNGRTPTHPGAATASARYGWMVTLIAVPEATVSMALCTSDRDIRSVIRSATGTAPEEISSRARRLCSGLEPLAPKIEISR